MLLCQPWEQNPSNISWLMLRDIYFFCIILKWLTAHCFLFGANVCSRTIQSKPLFFLHQKGVSYSTIFFLMNVYCLFFVLLLFLVLSCGLFCLATFLAFFDVFANVFRSWSWWGGLFLIVERSYRAIISGQGKRWVAFTTCRIIQKRL